MYGNDVTVKIDNYNAISWFVQLRNLSWSVELVECGSEMQIMVYTGERVHFCQSFTLSI